MYPKKFWNEFRLSKWRKRIFIGMSFDKKEVEKRYKNIIREAIKKTNLRTYFLKGKITGDSIPSDIMKGIIECKLVLFDISPSRKTTMTRNPNVMYELGLAHTWRNPEEVIVISDNVDNLPFDIQRLGVVKYSLKNKEKSIDKIKNTILFRLKQINIRQKSIVRKAAESLTLEAYKFLIKTKGLIEHDKDLKDSDKLLTVPLLLNLGLVELLTDGHGYGYHPTQLGREVIRFYNKPLEEDDIKTYKTLYKPEY